VRSGTAVWSSRRDESPVNLAPADRRKTGASLATPPSLPPLVTASPSLAPSVSSAASPALVVTPSTTPTAAKSSSGPQPSASLDLAAIIASNATYFSSKVTILDLAAGDLAVSVAFVDPSGGPPSPLATFTIGPSGQQSDALPPGTYRLGFRPSGSTTGSTCTITIAKGGLFTFVAVPGSIAVSRAGHPPTKAADLFVPTSSLCRA
jgi:hypothetical protein